MGPMTDRQIPSRNDRQTGATKSLLGPLVIPYFLLSLSEPCHRQWPSITAWLDSQSQWPPSSPFKDPLANEIMIAAEAMPLSPSFRNQETSNGSPGNLVCRLLYIGEGWGKNQFGASFPSSSFTKHTALHCGSSFILLYSLGLSTHRELIWAPDEHISAHWILTVTLQSVTFFIEKMKKLRNRVGK